MKGQMIGYVTVGTNDLERSKQFYDNLFEELGARSFFANERIFFGRSRMVLHHLQ